MAYLASSLALVMKTESHPIYGLPLVTVVTVAGVLPFRFILLFLRAV